MSVERAVIGLLERSGFKVVPDEALYESLGGGRVRHRRIVATSDRVKVVWSVVEELNIYELRIILWGSLPEQAGERLTSLGAVVDDNDQNTCRILLRGSLDHVDAAREALNTVLV